MEEPNQDGSLPFLDTKVTPGPNNTLITTVYRKPTHRPISTLGQQPFHSSKTQCLQHTSTQGEGSFQQPTLLNQGTGPHKDGITVLHFPAWALNKLQHIFEHRHYNNNEPSSTDSKHNNNHNNNGTSNNNNIKNISIVVPYIQRLGEKFKRTCNKKGIQVHFNGSNTIKTLLMAPKDKDTKLQKSGVIYKYKCPQMNCPEEYIGDTGRAFGDRLKEHFRAQSHIHQHSSSPGHPISPDCFSIVHTETQGTKRNIKEAMFIMANDPSLNRNIGKYQLPHVWDQILQDTLALQLK